LHHHTYKSSNAKNDLAMSENIIEVKNLEYSYNGFKAVDDVSFFVKEGEIFSFLGPNGAGKSTVINILTTLLPLQKGSARIAGYDRATDPEQIRRSIGIVFQDETLDRDLTVWETLELHGRLYSMPKDERRQRIEEMIELVELGDKRDTRTRNLSGGMKRRLEIGRGLMTRPKVLFLDEPTIGLDTQTRRRLWDYIKKVNESGTTIFLTTHSMDEADLVSNWIDILDHGKIIASGVPAELKNALGRDMVYMETSNNVAATETLKTLDSVRDVKAISEGLVVTINGDGTHLLPQMMNMLKDKGIEISSVNLKKPTLDDVFVHYTGRDIRNAGAEKLRRIQPRSSR
jgi:ABC-2 type transport system ATP-binding protein